jgi:hypothetical protein
MPQLCDQRAEILFVFLVASRFELTPDLRKLAPYPFQALPEFAAGASCQSFVLGHCTPPTQAIANEWCRLSLPGV